MGFQYRNIIVVLILVTLIFCPANGDVYYVTPSVTDCTVNASHNTLNYYANSTTLQLTDSVFYFIPGICLLHQTWVISNANNLTVTTLNYQQKRVVIAKCTRNSTDQGIRVINSKGVSLRSMEIISCRLSFDNENK